MINRYLKIKNSLKRKTSSQKQNLFSIEDKYTSYEVIDILKNLNLKKRKPFQWIIKRTSDLFISFVGIILILPLLIIVTIAIKLDSKGPVIFKQKRIGINKKPFYIYKFRSMVSSAENDYECLKNKNQTNPIMFKIFNDPRTTKIGKILRKFSIDELPQLFNVLKGEMSLVGPRPPLPREVEKYEKWHNVRFSTLPGITGLWQISGRSNIKKFDSVVKLDYKYISNWNILLDFIIVLKTIPIVLLGKDTG